MAVAVIILIQIGCNPTNSEEYKALLAEKKALLLEKEASIQQIRALTIERDQWKADPQANFKQIKEGFDHAQSSDDFQKVITSLTSFQGTFPTSNLNGAAKNLFISAKEEKTRALVVEEASRIAKERVLAQEQANKEAQERLGGSPTTFTEFYSKVESVGLPIGKRFRFIAFVDHTLAIHERRMGEEGYQRDFPGGSFIFARAAFDNPSEHEMFLKVDKRIQQKTVVASILADRHIYIHQLRDPSEM
jgi:hypothetical protein